MTGSVQRSNQRSTGFATAHIFCMSEDILSSSAMRGARSEWTDAKRAERSEGVMG